MNLSVNMLIAWPADAAVERIERVLWIALAGEDVVTIDIVDRQALPVRQRHADLEAALAAQQARILEVDPYAHLFRPEETIPEKHRQRRDESWEIIAPLAASGLDLFIPGKRGALVAAAVLLSLGQQ